MDGPIVWGDDTTGPPDLAGVHLPPPPPIDEPPKGPGPGPGDHPGPADPAMPFLTWVMLGSLVAFGGFQLFIMGVAGGSGGQAMAWALGGFLGGGYLLAVAIGALWFERYRTGEDEVE